jgi:hypothetical protein
MFGTCPEDRSLGHVRAMNLQKTGIMAQPPLLQICRAVAKSPHRREAVV